MSIKPVDNLKCIFAVSKFMSKLSNIRENNNKKRISELLENTDYFQRLVSDPNERKELLQHARKYMRYKFFPKGTLIHDYKETISSFSVILKGKAMLYTPKKPEQIKKEDYDLQKSQVIQEYIQYIDKEQLNDKLKKWLTRKEVGTKALRKRLDMISTTVGDSHRPSEDVELGDFSTLVNSILTDKKEVLPLHLQDCDLSIGEKFLLISHFGEPGEYIKGGVFNVAAHSELKDSSTFGEIGLLKPIPAEYCIVATEDLHLVSFRRDDFRLLFTLEITNLQNKLQFLTKIFSDTSTSSLVKIAYFLEEKTLASREVLYKEGEESKAIYFIQKGEVQINFMKSTKLTKVSSMTDIRTKIRPKQGSQQRVIVGNLQIGAMFGEEEIIQKENRKYTAVSTQSQTMLYVLRSEIYNEIFEKHFPHIAEAFKEWMKIKSTWRKQRLNIEEELDACFEASQKKQNPYFQDIENKNNELPKFYSPRKEFSIEQEVITTNRATGEERITFKVISNQPAPSAFFSSVSQNHLKQNFQMNLESRLFKIEKSTLATQKVFANKEKLTPRRTQQSKVESFTKSLNDLITPRGLEKKISKNSSIVMSELASTRPTLSKKPTTLLSLDNNLQDSNGNMKIGFSLNTMPSLKNIDSNRVYSSKNTMTPNKQGIFASLKKDLELAQLSKEGFNLLRRIGSNNKLKENDVPSTERPQKSQQELGMHIRDQFLLMEKERKTRADFFQKNRSNVKTSSMTSLDEKLESNPDDAMDYNLGSIKSEKFRIKKKGSQESFRITKNKLSELHRANTISINNLELNCLKDV